MISLQQHPSKVAVVIQFHQSNGPNAFDALSGKELLRICSALKKNPPQALAWISGHPQFYCTGGDLRSQLRSPKIKSTLKDHLTIRTALQHLDAIPCPKVTLVDGDCYGGGMEILSCFHHVIATPRAIFGFWQRRMGLSFGWGGGQRLLRRISENELRRFALSQQMFSAWSAREAGLVDEVCDVPLAHQAIDRWLSMQGSLGKDTARLLPAWTSTTESQVFRKLYGGSEHLSVLKQLSQRREKS